MIILSLRNPYGARVYFLAETGSTMDDARLLAAQGAGHGTVVVADRQTSGRGRIRGRAWLAEPGESLLCTLILRFRDIPKALTLRIGLAVCQAVEDLLPHLAGRIRIKWPNDLLVEGRKVCGILCEGEGNTVYAGIGVNVSQRAFPEDLQAKATSLALAVGSAETDPPDRFKLLETLLTRLAKAFPPSPAGTLGAAVGAAAAAGAAAAVGAGASAGASDPETGAQAWRDGVGERLFRRGGRVRFLDGAADLGRLVEGVLVGIGGDGELLIRLDGEAAPRPFLTGELEM